MSPPIPDSSERRIIVERRTSLERRVGERRHAVTPVARERRRAGKRRSTFDRRESAAGHVRNAIQLLESLLSDEDLDPALQQSVRQAVQRLWLSVREIDRLAAGRQHLGVFLRRVGSGSGRPEES